MAGVGPAGLLASEKLIIVTSMLLAFCVADRLFCPTKLEQGDDDGAHNRSTRGLPPVQRATNAWRTRRQVGENNNSRGV